MTSEDIERIAKMVAELDEIGWMATDSVPEIVRAVPELLRLARVGAAYIAERRTQRNWALLTERQKLETARALDAAYRAATEKP